LKKESAKFIFSASTPGTTFLRLFQNWLIFLITPALHGYFFLFPV
jgi:hypothetical protein